LAARCPLGPYTTLFRSSGSGCGRDGKGEPGYAPSTTLRAFPFPRKRGKIRRCGRPRRWFLPCEAGEGDRAKRGGGGVIFHLVRRSEEHTSELQSRAKLV